jgi:hypothetical protein
MKDEMGRKCSTHGDMRNVYRILIVNLKVRNDLLELNVIERIILKLILKSWGVGAWDVIN